MRTISALLLLATLMLSACVNPVQPVITTQADTAELKIYSLNEIADAFELKLEKGEFYKERYLKDAKGHTFHINPDYADRYWLNGRSFKVEYPHISYREAEEEVYVPQGMYNSIARNLGRLDLLDEGKLKVYRPHRDDVSLVAPKVEKVEPAKSTTESKQPLKGLKVVVDAGHGGKDPGGIGVQEIQEKSIALDVSKRVCEKLEALGATVVMTRTTDVFLELQERSALANTAQADLFISVHANIGGSKAKGIETWYRAGGPRGSKSAAFSKALNDAMVKSTGAVDRGARSDQRGLHVLRVTKMPAALVEVGFMDNPKEGPRLKIASYRERIAQGIVKGVINFRTQA